MRFFWGILRWVGLLVAVVVLYLIAGAIYSYNWGDQPPKDEPMAETLDKNENFYTAQIIEAAIELSMEGRADLIAKSPNPHVGKDDQGHTVTTAPGFNTKDYRRDVHTKSHGCVKASFTVAQDLPARLAWGIFAQPGKQYPAVIRFSNGQAVVQSDGVPDARGFAMKVYDVPGPKLLDPQQPDDTQDFIMINSKVFFIRTIEEYLAFSKALGQGGNSLTDYFFPSKLNPATWHVREMVLANDSFKQRPDSLVTESYYSLSAYKLGPRDYVKYSVQPCSANHPLYTTYAGKPNFFAREWRKLTWLSDSINHTSQDPPGYFDYLRDELANQVHHGKPCFEFMVQLQDPEANMPIEDTTVEWNEKVSPFLPVARITINPVATNTPEMNEICENLSFNPWHSLPDNRPAGVMNRVRKSLYQSMAAYRRNKNCAATCPYGCEAPVPGQTPAAGFADPPLVCKAAPVPPPQAVLPHKSD